MILVFFFLATNADAAVLLLPILAIVTKRFSLPKASKPSIVGHLDKNGKWRLRSWTFSWSKSAWGQACVLVSARACEWTLL